MRIVPLTSAAFALSASLPGFAQSFDWTDYVSREDYFSVSFPGEPSVEEVAYPTEYRITLPGRVYSHDDGAYRYSVTVVDYRNAVDIHLARNEACRAAGGDGNRTRGHGIELEWD